MTIQLVTKQQALAILQAWGCTEPLPPKGKALYVAFPNRTLAVVTKTDKRVTDGRGLLYSIEHC